jgi:drug/metabolite transporter (DMT)-like permease
MAPQSPDAPRDGRFSSARFRLFAALGAVYFIWGSTYLAIRVAIETLPPLLHAGVRFLVAGVILYSWALFRTTERPTWSQWKTAILSGFLMLFIGNGAVVWAEQFVPSGMVSLIVATVLLWIVLLDWGFGRGKAPAAGVLFGIFWGFGGVVLLVTGSEIGQATPQHLLGGLLVLAGSGAWAAGSLITRYWDLPRSAALGTGMQMLVGGFGLFLGGLLRGELGAVDLTTASGASVLALLYLIVFGSLIAFSAYIWLLQNTTPAVASTYAYVNPMVALLLGWALADEPLSSRTILAAFIILSAVMIIATQRSRGGPREREKG